MQQKWYQQSEQQISAFFAVNLQQGLSADDALRRLHRFGKQSNGTMNDSLFRVLKTTVIRGGEKKLIPLSQLVPGDIVLLEEGNRVPANIRLLSVHSFRVNQNAVTGETLPAIKSTFAISSEVPLSQQKNMAFTGTFVTQGSAKGVVVDRDAQSKRSHKKHRIALKGTVIARRLRRFGLMVLDKKPLGVFRKIDTVVIDCPCSETEIIDIIRKVQLTRQIDCKFVIANAARAQQLGQKLQAEIYNATTKKGTMATAQFITGVDDISSLHVARQLHDDGRIVLWQHDGKQRRHVDSLVAMYFVIGTGNRDDVVLLADIYGPKAKPTILERILYNKK